LRLVTPQNNSTVFVFDIVTLQIKDLIGVGLPIAIDGPGVPIDDYDDIIVIGSRDSFQVLGCAFVYQSDEYSDLSFQGLVLIEVFPPRAPVFPFQLTISFCNITDVFFVRHF